MIKRNIDFVVSCHKHTRVKHTEERVTDVLGDLCSNFARLGKLRQLSAQHAFELYTAAATLSPYSIQFQPHYGILILARALGLFIYSLATRPLLLECLSVRLSHS